MLSLSNLINLTVEGRQCLAKLIQHKICINCNGHIFLQSQNNDMANKSNIDNGVWRATG